MRTFIRNCPDESVSGGCVALLRRFWAESASIAVRVRKLVVASAAV